MELKIIKKLLKFNIPEEYENREDVLVCHCCTLWALIYTLFMLALESLVVSLLMTSWEVAANGIEISNIALYPFSVVIIIFAVVTVQRILEMKNKTVILHKYGVWYRDTLGRIYSYTDAEINTYFNAEHARHSHIMLHTEKRDIIVERYATNFRFAKTIIKKKYKEI